MIGHVRKTMNKLRILLADDHQVMREGLRLLIDAQPDMEVIGEANNGRDALSQACDVCHDVIVLDISMPQLNGLQVMTGLNERGLQRKVLILTQHSDESYLHELLHAGARGYLLKRSVPEELAGAIRQVAAGQTYIDPDMARRVQRAAASNGHWVTVDPDCVVTPREEQVLRLLAEGHTKQEMATRLNIPLKMVETCKAHAMDKLNLKNRVDIVRYAIDRGWLQDA